MPKYEYDCPRCGRFADYRPLADYALPSSCPDCGTESARAALSSPAISTAPSSKSGKGAAANRLATSGHGAGCRCCGGKSFNIPRAEWVQKLL